MSADQPFGQPDPALRDFVLTTYQPEDSVLLEVRRRSVAAGLPDIHVSALDGRHLTTITAAVGAGKAVEIGTLGGYSGICILRGMRADGVLHTFELEPGHAAVAAESFCAAGFADRARIHVGPALERLDDVAGEAPFDLVFIDADKQGYPRYLAWAARHLRRGGAVLLDNAFLFGELGAPPRPDRVDVVRAMREAHERLAGSGTFIATVLPTAEGLAFGVRVG
jgi:caffeoyl-CoA O-methyltransferase